MPPDSAYQFSLSTHGIHSGRKYGAYGPSMWHSGNLPTMFASMRAETHPRSCIGRETSLTKSIVPDKESVRPNRPRQRLGEHPVNVSPAPRPVVTI